MSEPTSEELLEQMGYLLNQGKLDEASELEILLPGDKYYLNGLAFRTVSDSEVPKKNPFSMITMRRRGIQFSHLTPFQELQLRVLIQKVLSGRAGARPSAEPYKTVTAPIRVQHTLQGKALLFDQAGGRG